MIKDLTLDKLTRIAIACEAMVTQRAFGFMLNRRFSETSKLCEDRIEFDTELKNFRTRVQSLPKGQIDIATLKAEEREINERVLDDVEIKPIEIIESDELISKFTDSNVTAVVRNAKYDNIDPYASFHYLIKVGVVQLINEKKE